MATTNALSALDNNVLLEAGTNEVEILVFHVGDQRYGVNVAKVREVRQKETTTRLPNYPPAVCGMLRIRDSVVPLVDLASYLWNSDRSSASTEQESDLVLEFNNQMIAFRVQRIERIFRVSWKSLSPLPECPGLTAPVTGVLLLDGAIVSLLDFEAIGGVLGINGDAQGFKKADPGKSTNRLDCPVVYVDDSQLIRKMLGDAMKRAGYTNVHGFTDGQEAWDYLAKLADGVAPDKIAERVAIVISDIEMPRMDGFTLTKQIRAHDALKSIPVVLFSSLVSKDNEKKGKQVGATAQISKPNWEDLTSTLTNLLTDLLGQS